MLVDFIQNTLEFAQFNLAEVILLVNLYTLYQVFKIKKLIAY